MFSISDKNGQWKMENGQWKSQDGAAGYLGMTNEEFQIDWLTAGFLRAASPRPS